MTGHVRGDVRKAAAERDEFDLPERFAYLIEQAHAEGYEEGSRRRMDYAAVSGYELGYAEGAKVTAEHIAAAIEAERTQRWATHVATHPHAGGSPDERAYGVQEAFTDGAHIARTVDQ